MYKQGIIYNFFLAMSKSISSLWCLFVLSLCTCLYGMLCKEDVLFLQEENGRYLQHHIIATTYAPSLEYCREFCLMIDNYACKSVNYRTANSSCDLNDSDHFEHPHDLIDYKDYQYSSRKNDCIYNACPANSVCHPNYETGGHSCECLKGFYPVGQYCVACSPDWSHFNGSCYKAHNTLVSWRDARRNCQFLGGDLAVIKSAQENNFVADLTRSQSKTTSVWIGLFRDFNQNFQWIDGSLLAGQYSNWATGEPSYTVEECGMIYSGNHKHGKWNDEFCTFKWIAICEKAAAH